MPETYEDAVDRKQEETPEEEEHLEGFVNVADEFTDEAREQVEEEVEDISVTIPDFLKPGRDVGGDVPEPDRNDPRGEFGLDIDLDELQNLDTPALLQIIARIELAQLSTLIDMSNYMEPYNNITVSGNNAIDDDNSVQPLVPQSDTTDIQTRVLFVRADEDNNDTVVIGDSKSKPESGFILGPGEVFWVEADLRGETLYMSSETEGQVVQLLGMA
jgi:hypothetical protein